MHDRKSLWRIFRLVCSNNSGHVRMGSTRGCLQINFLRCLIVGCTTLALLTNPIAAQVVAPDSTVAGKTMGEWTKEWALWAFTEPEETNPTFDLTGEFQHLNQEGPVWFLPGSHGVEQAISFNVPSDKYLFAPIIIGWEGSGEDDDDLERLAQILNDANDIAGFKLDGFTIPENELLADYRAASGEFYYHLPDPSLADPDEGYVAFDGHWVMLEPLSPGEHNLHIFGGVSSESFYGERTFIINSVAVGDFDASGVLDVGDIDLLSAEVRVGTNNPAFNLTGEKTVDQADRTFWVEDLKQTWFGDSNLDGEFNTGDLVAIFQAGQYEDDVEQNSTWATGDWNGDTEFDTTDLVFAFQDGGFEVGQRVATNAVPEPASCVLLLLSLIAFATRRRAWSWTIHRK